MKRAIIILPLIFVTLVSLGLGYGKRTDESKKAGSLNKTAITGDNVVFDINNIKTYIRNNGSFNRNPGTGNAGFEWPKNSGKTAIYASGLWMGAKSGGTIRVAIAEYSYEFEAGPIAAGVNPNDSQWKMYKIKRGDDATNNPDYANWPFADGAPALRNFTNTADSLDGFGKKIPQLLGDMTSWCVYNDNNPDIHTNIGTLPLGVEIQMTVWGFARADALGDAFFVRWKVINKGGRQLDSTYVSIWSDCDIGGGAADYDGCDTLLGLGYTYSGDASNTQYGSSPPAAGFDFLQGPIVPSPGDTVYLPDGTVKPGYKKLQMTSYIRYDNDNTIELGNPFTGQEVYNYFRSLTRSGLPIKYGPDTSRIVRFMYPGDPTSAYSTTNWVENGGASDRRFMMSAGPFTMLPGDTQDVVGGCLIAQGSSNLSSVTALKNADALVQTAYDLNFQLPAPPPAPIVEVTPLDNAIVLTWGKNETKAEEIEGFTALDPIAQAGGVADPYYKFEGYVVYQYDNTADLTGSHIKIVETFDVKNGITDIYDDVFDPNLGAYVRKPVKRGTDKGVFRSIRIAKDAFTGARIVNNKDYYFGVTSYAYAGQSVPRSLESSTAFVIVRPRKILMGSQYSSSGLDTIGTWSPVVMRTIADHPSGVSAGYTIPVVVQPDSVTGDTYEIQFHLLSGATVFNIVNTTKNIVLDSNRTNMADNESHPIKNGIMFKVVDAPYTLARLFTIPSDPTKDWIYGDPTYGLHYMGGGMELGINTYDWIYYGWHPTLTFGNYVPVKLAIDSSNPGWVYRYRRLANAAGPGGYRMVYQNMVKAPFKAWDISNPANPRQLNISFRDQLNIGSYDIANPYNLVLVSRSSYDTTGAAYTGINGGPFESDGMYAFSFAAASGLTVYAASDTLVMVPYKVNAPSDIFRINTANYKPTPGNIGTAKTQIERINVVPNPYFAANAYEQNQFNKVIRITNLPAKVKIRIFNLAGELVNVLEKDDPTRSDLDWNLTNRNSLPVASGMYIIHIDMGAIGTKIIKVAVIMAEERLDNF